MSGGSSTTTKQQSDPWGPALPYIQQILGQSQAIYNRGVHAPDFETVVQPSQQTQDAWQLISQRAKNGSPVVQGAQNALLNLLTQHGVNAAIPYAQSLAAQGPQLSGNNALASAAAGNIVNPFAGALQNLANNSTTNPAASLVAALAAAGPQYSGTDIIGNVASGGVSNAQLGALGSYAGGGAQSPAEQYLAAAARGDYLNANPYLDDAANRLSSKVRDSVNATFGSAGRTGSVAHQGKLSEDIGSVLSDFYAKNYANERGLQQQAAGQIQGAYDAAQGRGLTAAGQLAGFGESDVDRRLAAAQALAGLGSQGYDQKLQALGAFGNLSAQDLDRALSAATTYAQLGEAQAGRQIGAAESLSNFGLEDYRQRLAAADLLGSLSGADLSRNASNVLAGLPLAPLLADYDYADLDRLAGVGTSVEAQRQKEIDDLLTRFEIEQQGPRDLLSWYAGNVLPIAALGGSQTASEKTKESLWSQIIGLAMASAKLAAGA